MDIPKYFSNVVLAQYVVTGIPLKVYVNGEYLIIPDVYEISDPLLGSGMDVDGHMQQFDYRMIDHIMVGGNIVDLATYTKALAARVPPLLRCTLAPVFAVSLVFSNNIPCTVA